MREKIWNFLESSDQRVSKILDGILSFLVILSAILFYLEYRDPSFAQATPHSIISFEWFVASLFCLQYFVRLWACPNRMKYVVSFGAIIDLLSFAPYVILMAIGFPFNSLAVRIFRIVRVAQILKLFRYSHLKIRTKIFLAFSVSTLCILIPTLYFVFDYVTDLKEKDIKQTLLSEVIIISRLFTAEEVLRIRGEADPEYIRIQKEIRDIRDHLRNVGIPVHYIYFAKKHPQKPKTLVYIVDAEEKGEAHSDFGLEYDTVKNDAQWSLDFSKAQVSPHFDFDDDGETLVLSGLAPLPSLQKISPVVVQVDILAHDVENAERRIGWMVIITLTTAVLLIALVSLTFSHYFNRPINELIKGIEAFENQEYDYQVKVLSEDELGRVGELFNTRLFVLMRDFFRFMYAPVAKMLLGPDRDALIEGKYEHASILFTDFRGFTAKSKEYAPRQVVEYLNRSFRVLESVVTDHQGIVDKHIGDALMAYFIPLPGETNTAKRAVECALKMQQAYDTFYQETLDKGGLICELRIGVNSGDVILGAIGAEKLEVTVIGNSVNLANRMESASIPGGVGISQTTTTQSLIKKWISEFPGWSYEETLADVKHLDNVPVTLLRNESLAQSKAVQIESH